MTRTASSNGPGIGSRPKAASPRRGFGMRPSRARIFTARMSRRAAAIIVRKSKPLYTLTVLERATLRLTPVTARTADLAPVVPACCNVCRTCTTTNLISLGVAMVAGAGFGLARFAKRLTRRA